MTVALLSIALPIYYGLEWAIENIEKEEPSKAQVAPTMEKRIEQLEKEVQALHKMHEVAAHDRNRLMDGLISVYDIVKDIGFVSDPKRKPPKLKMWHCVDPVQVPVGVVR